MNTHTHTHTHTHIYTHTHTHTQHGQEERKLPKFPVFQLAGRAVAAVLAALLAGRAVALPWDCGWSDCAAEWYIDFELACKYTGKRLRQSSKKFQ